MIHHKKNFIVNNLLGSKSPAVRNVSNALIAPILKKRGDNLRSVFRGLFTGKTPYFYQVAVETCSFCNFSCRFCPASVGHDKRGKHFMDMNVAEALAAKLKKLRFNGLISLFNNNEPLLDENLPVLVSLFRHEVKDARIEIFTNGLLLDMAKAESLWDAGLDSIVIEHFIGNVRSDLRLKKFTRDYAKSYRSKTRDITINHLKNDIVRSNRGGNAPNAARTSEPIEAFCHLPFIQFNVNYKGDVQLCCNDVYYNEIMGNILREDIEAIWNSQEYRRVRSLLLNEKRDFGICRACDNKQTLRGCAEIIYQEPNNQLLIPGLVDNVKISKPRRPFKKYPLKFF